MVTVTLPVRELMPVLQNDGGYLTVRCIVCDRIDLSDRFKHKPDCAVGKALEKSSQNDS
jgi:hypothetical protein